MAIEINGYRITKVTVIDDNEDARTSQSWPIEDMDLEAYCPTGPLGEIENALATVISESHAVVSDHHLKVSGFAAFNGAELAAKLYKCKIPTVLYSSWSFATPDEVLPYREWIPILLETPPEPEDMIHGFETCLKEFKGEFSQKRKPWRALVRVEEVRRKAPSPVMFVVLPSWNASKVIRVPLSMVPEDICVSIREGMRLHAHVNLAAETGGDLFFSNWEPS